MIFNSDKANKIEKLILKKVKERVQKYNRDYKGSRFIAYTEEYAKRKKDPFTGIKGVNPDKVNLTLTGLMLYDFYVKVTIEPHDLDIGGSTISVGKLKIKYGFYSTESKVKYEWNVKGRIRKDGKSSARDFLGIYNNEWLLKEKDLRRLIADEMKKR